MSHIKAWDYYEAILLLDTILDVRKNKKDEKKSIQYLSNLLREHAILNSVIIDDKYRNYSGIYFQYGVMSKLLGEDNFIDSSPSELFKTIYMIYKNTPDLYLFLKNMVYKRYENAREKLNERLLRELRDKKIASTMDVDKSGEEQEVFYILKKMTTKEVFLLWLKDKGNFFYISNLDMYLNTIYRYGKYNNIISSELLEIKQERILKSLLKILKRDRYFENKYKVDKDIAINILEAYIRFCAVKVIMREGNAVNSLDHEEEQIKNNEKVCFDNEILTYIVNLDDTNDDKKYISTVPYGYYFNKQYYGGFNSWVDLYVDFINVLIKINENRLEAYLNRGFISTTDRIDISSDKVLKFYSYRVLNNGWYLEVNYTPAQFLDRINYLLNIYDINKNELSILYTSKDVYNANVEYFNGITKNEDNKDEKMEKNSKGIEKIHSLISEYDKEIKGMEQVYTLNWMDLDIPLDACPVRYLYFEDEFKGAATWKEFYSHLIKTLWEDYEDRFYAIEGKSFDETDDVDFVVAWDSKKLKYPYYLGREYYIELELSPYKMLTKIRNLLQLCDVDVENLTIEFKSLYKYPIIISTSNCENESRAKSFVIREKGEFDNYSCKNEELVVENKIMIVLEKNDKGFDFSTRQLEYLRKSIGDDSWTGERLDKFLKKKLIVVPSGLSKRGYLPEQMIPKSLGEAISDYILEAIEKNDGIVFYSSVFNKFESLLSKTKAFKIEFLKLYIDKIFENQFCFNKEYLTINSDCINISQSIEKLFVGEARVLSINEIQTELNYIPLDFIEKTLEDKKIYLKNENQEYIYVPSIILNKEEKALLISKIQQEIENYGYFTLKEAYVYSRYSMKQFWYDNDFISEQNFYDYCKIILTEKFSIKDGIISSPYRPIKKQDLFERYCKKNRKVTLQQIDNFFRDLGVENINWTLVTRIMIRINSTTFMLKEDIHFDICEIDNCLMQHIQKKYICISDIVNYSFLPDIEIPWNEYILSEYIDQYSQLFEVKRHNITREGVFGIIVYKGLATSSLTNLMSRIAIDFGIDPKEEALLDFFVTKKVLARRTYSDIQQVISDIKVKKTDF